MISYNISIFPFRAVLPQKPICSEIQQDQSFLSCVVGSIQASWHLDRMGYLPGEALLILGEINNKSRMKVKRSKASLVQVRPGMDACS